VALHFGLTSIVTLCLAKNLPLANGENKNAPMRVKIFLAILACFSVVLDNMALARLPQLTHQMIRILVTPATAFIGQLTLESTVDRSSVMRLFGACCGVAISVQSEVQYSRTQTRNHFSLWGILIALFGILVRALYSVEVSRTQRYYELDSLKLLSLQMPWAFLFTLSVGSYVDTWPELEKVSREYFIAIVAVSEVFFFSILMHLSAPRGISLINS
jgi:solute carrier family 35, member E3